MPLLNNEKSEKIKTLITVLVQYAVNKIAISAYRFCPSLPRLPFTYLPCRPLHKEPHSTR